MNEIIQKLLKEKEERIIFRKKFINDVLNETKYDASNITFLTITINYPGPNKNGNIVKLIFEESIRALKINFFKNNIISLKEIKIKNSVGPVKFIAARIDPQNLKKITVNIEENHYLGRFFDLDIYNYKGEALTRKKVGLSARKCYLCELNANLCRRLQKHSYEELKYYVKKQMENYQKKQKIVEENFIKSIEIIAYEALMEELSASPKPGLIDKLNNGSHKDMDYLMMKKSAKAIKNFFSMFAKQGMYIAKNNTNNEQAMELLKGIGLKAEEEMFLSTGGVNTHRGVIFSLGIITAATGYFFVKPKGREELLSNNIAEIAANWLNGITKNELENKSICKLENTHGEEVFKSYKVYGARGEAEAGFPSVIQYGLPALKKAVYKYKNLEKAYLETLLVLMSKIDDTNILYRGNISKLKKIKALARKTLDLGGFKTEKGKCNYNKLIEYMEENKLSPGGSADLLIVSIYFYKLKNILFRLPSK